MNNLLFEMAAKRELRPGILDRPLSKTKGEVALSSFSLLFSEIVQYSQNRVLSIGDLERKYYYNDCLVLIAY